MKKKVLFAAMALVALASCTSDEVVSPSSPPEPTPTDLETSEAIVFSSASKGITRADLQGVDAAEKLGNAFVVSGYKGAKTKTVGSIVFDNYLVTWGENTAYTTESNTTNWEYVGVTPIKHATDNGITSQKIKYWDYSVDQYDFIAWSTGSKTAIYEGTPTAGKVLVSKIIPSSATTAAYTFTGSAADLSECYIADLVTVNKLSSPAPGNGEDAPYGKAVKFSFRQLGTKVRIGLYETVPGYSVKKVKFYSAAASNDADEEKARLFTTQPNEIFTKGTYKVYFPTVDEPNNVDNNQAHVSFEGSGDQKTIVDDWGGLNYTIAEEGEKTEGNVFLGRSSNTASFAGDAEKNYYEIYLPNQTGTTLHLRVDYTLESTDGSGEVINVKGATAQVPLIYTQWKPGFAYTYLFKISDKTNGHTGVYDPTQPDDTSVNSDPAGLYPITFDAVVVNAEDNDQTQETITLVATPSITTYQQKSTVVNADEYTVNGQDIFVTVNEGDDIVPLKKYKGGDPAEYDIKAALYTIPAGKTEAEVIDALQMRDDDAVTGTIKGRSGLVLTAETHELTNTVIYGADGNAITITATNGEQKALRFAPTASTTYAFVYTKTAPTGSDEVKYQALNWDNFESGQTKYRYDYKAPTTADAQKGVKYFLRTGDAAPYTYTMQDPFIGQGVGNLYLNVEGTTIAKGYAVTGTTYYYSYMDGSIKKYKAAHNVNYAEFAAATDLYTFNGTDYTLKPTTVTTPADGVAYYQRTGEGTTESPYVFTYCVILPQQTTGWYELDTTKYDKATETAEVVGQTYFDKYTKNNGVYYVKVIKVQ